MRTLMLLAFITIASNAFASSPLSGDWYLPFARHGQDYSPESLVQFSDDGVMTTERIFPGSNEKVTTSAQIAVTNSTITFVKDIVSADCPNLHDEPMTGAKLSYSITGNTLTLLLNKTPIGQMVRASQAQIQKFANTPEGCN